MQGPLTRRTLTDRAELTELRSDWESLLARCRKSEPTLSPTWMLPWWDVFGGEGDRALKALALYDGARLVGLAPLLSRTASYRPGLHFRRLEMLASGEEEADETCSEYLGLLAAEDYERAVAEAFVDAVYDGELGPWDELVLPSMAADKPLPHFISEAMRGRGVDVELSPRPASPYVPLPSTWEKYLELLPSRRRYVVRRSMRALETWSGGTQKLHFARTLAELPEARETLIVLHRERWAADGRPGVFDSRCFRAFHDRVMPELLARGALQLGWLESRGEPIAAFYNIVWNGTSYFYQGGRRVDLPREVRAGIAMHASLIQHNIEIGNREYDFLSGSSQYKMTLSLATRPLLTLRAVRPSLAEVARKTVELAVAQVRRLRDSVRPRPAAA